ncbi:hypothetical protein F5Y19DRAFT_386002 [Xylariaceae sp. FL1651]|nr:hypothetical protein F5Y19DRAFT_386002 [Xylariaceae sp. FL1651]
MTQQQPLPDLANIYRELYRARFRADVQAGTTKPFIVPFHLLAYWVVPTLYLAISHKNRPWLYHARWLVLAFVVAFHWHMIRNVGSLNFASSYGTGLLAAWAIVWNFTLLVWTRPQWDAKRVERRRKIRRGDQVEDSQGSDRPPTLSGNGHASELEANESNSRTSVQLEADENASELIQNGRATISRTTGLQANGDEKHIKGTRERQRHATPSTPLPGGREVEEKLLMENIITLNTQDGNPALELSNLTREQEYEYYWQEYPADASFWTRLDWAFDIVSSFRLTGWNWSPFCFPPYQPPPKIGPYQLPLEYGPHRSKQGYERTLSRRELVISRTVFNIIPSYIIVDFCATLMTSDPYFILGPEHNHPLPRHLASLSPLLLSLQRTVLAFVGIVSALQFVWNCGAVALALYCPPILGFRAHPWHLPSMSGSFTQVLDRGLAGFWGAWWHQTFRVGFSAPTKWLLARGYLPSSSSSTHKDGRSGLAMVGPLLGALVAFAQSALLHGAGSYSTVPATHHWGPPLFFALAGAGTVLQTVLSHVLRRRIEKLPQSVRRLGNLAFVFLWLWATSWALLDDFGRCGIWLWEPVPVSVARAVGLGDDKRVWRYDADFFPQWHWGARGRWWETGVAI